MGHICSQRRIHSQLIHLIFRIDPFDPDKVGRVKSVTFEKSNEEEDAQELNADDNSLPDAFLNLVVALVSANSVFLAPTLNALWRLIITAEPALPDGVHLFANEVSIDLTHENGYETDVVTTTTEKQDDDDDGRIQENKKKSECHVRHVQKNSRLHGTLSKILHLVPKGRAEIFPILASSFPFKLSPLSKQMSYVKQCLIVLRYVPTMEQQFLALCMDRCLEIDVEIRIATNGSVQIEGDAKDELHDTNADRNTQKVMEEEKNNGEELKRLEKEKSEEQKVDEMAEKLDFLMLLIFQYLRSSSNLEYKAIRLLYRMIIPAFDSVILTTHRSKYVQFIILYICGLDNDASITNNDENTNNEDAVGDTFIERPKLYREFASKLINIILDPYCATLTRQSSTCYLASFVSRATFVCTETACESVAALLRFAEAYMETFPTAASARNARKHLGNEAARMGVKAQVEKHSLFYTVCQAAFYIMCFRGADCIRLCRNEFMMQQRDDEEIAEGDESSHVDNFEHIDISTNRWTRLCSHHLQPLRYCLESVRGEFLFLSDTFDLVEDGVLAKLIAEDRQMASGFLKPVSKRNTSLIQTPATLEKKRRNGVGGLGIGKNPLDSFFPFDPYLLFRSYTFVEPYYRQWEGSAVEHDVITEDQNMTSEDESCTDASDIEDNSEHGELQNAIGDSDSTDEHLMTNLQSTSPVADDTLKETEMKKPLSNRDTWVQELKRARALSIPDDCW